MSFIDIVCKKICTVTVAIALAFTSVPMEISATSNNNALHSIVKSYKKNSYKYTLTTNARFYISIKNTDDTKPATDLIDTLELISTEFATQGYPSTEQLDIVWGDETDVQEGDILIRIKEGMVEEAYRLKIKKKAIVTAGDVDGIFYGLRTLLQLFMSNGSVKIQGCSIKDTPGVKERTVHLDCARKYYSKKWIVKLIKEMSYMRYNSLEIHFNEDQALRLESKTFPWLAGATEGSGKYLTQHDMKKICKVANKYHIDIIPSFDSPGHMDYIVETYAEYVKENPNYKFEYDGVTYSKKTEGFKNISNYFQYNGDKSDYNYRGIDVTNQVALAFTNALIDEYADFFAQQGCTKFNIGGDELLGWAKVTVGGKTFDFNTKWKALEHWDKYAKNTLGIKNGSASDTFINYLNTLATRLENKNYTVRVWSDEIDRNDDQHISLKESIDIVYWSNDFEPIGHLEKNGNLFYNAVAEWCYYVVRKDSEGNDLMDTTYKNVNGKSIYNDWNPKSFASPGGKKRTVKKSQLGGAYFCIWGDMPTYKSLSKIRKETRSRMWANSVKMWNPKVNTKKSGNGKALTYKKFKQYTKMFY